MAYRVYYKAAKEWRDPATGAIMLRPAKKSSSHVFDVGSKHVLDGVPEMCRHGFHASLHPAVILLNPEFGYTVDDVLLKVNLGPETGVWGDGRSEKVVSCTMTVLSRISWADALVEAGTWRDCSFTLDGDTLKLVRPNGDMVWWRHGKLHRDNNLPAFVDGAGRGQCFYKDGLPHRENDLPAVDFWNRQEWFIEGKRHRVGGPAVKRQGEKEEWWEHGVFIRRAE